MNKITGVFLLAFTAAMALFFSNLAAKKDKIQPVSETPKVESNRSILILESGDFTGNGNNYLIILDKKTNRRVLYFHEAMVVLPE